MTLPTNPQAMSASERLILETLHQQGETLSYQTKVLQALTNQVTRQRRNDEKVSKKTNPSPMVERNKKSSDDYLEKFKDYSAELFGKAMGDIREYFASQIKTEKPSPSKMSEATEPVDTRNEKSKNKKSKNTEEDKDVIKNILQSMIATNKYQEQLTENLKSLKILSDKTLSSVSLIQDNINTIKTSNEYDNDIKVTEKNTFENPNKRTPLNTKTVKNTDPLDIVKFSKSIGFEVSSRLIPSFDKLGKTFTDDIEYAVETLSEILSNNESNSTTLGPAPGRGTGQTPKPKGGAGGLPKASGAPGAAAALPALSEVLPFATAAGSLLAIPTLLSNMDDPEDLDRMRKKEKAEKEAASKKNDTRQTAGRLETNKNNQKYTEVPEGEVIPYNGKDYKKQADGSLADDKGNVLSRNVQQNVEASYLNFLNKKGRSTVEFHREMNSKMDQLLNENSDNKENQINRSLVEKPPKENSTNKEKLNSAGQRGPDFGEKENYERLQRAEKLPKETIEWAKKNIKDPNIADPSYLAEPKNSEILKWLEDNQKYMEYEFNTRTLIGNFPGNKKEEKEKTKPKAKNVSQNLDVQPMASILNGIEKENVALSENNAMNAAPIIVNNNTTVASSGSGSGISFASGSPVNTNSAINDFFRYNGRIFA